MRKVLLISIMFLLMTGFNVAWAQDDIQQHPNCSYCGMDRAKFAHSRMSVEYDDGSMFGACSIHCAAIDMAVNIDKTPVGIGVGDYNTKKLIRAEKAFWVIGGEKTGVMTQRATWAFENQDDAQNFIQKYGGELASFEESLKTAYENMYQDTRMIREKRKMMRMKMKKK
ncbi:MAG: nitrous oxide reductase accessory protein NosL [Desulfobacteraceae bacterium]|nr:nitrous oxide reductase accessory protein NosL [Desulfobacteraceae bacterium]